MKRSAKRELLAMVKQYFPEVDTDPGWLTNYFVWEKFPYLDFSARKPFGKLIAATLTAVSLFGLSESGWIVFPQTSLERCRANNWRSLPRSVRWVQDTSLEDLGLLIRQQFVYFRHPEDYEDNYNIIDSSGQWAIIFCHHDDWHAFHKDENIIKNYACA